MAEAHGSGNRPGGSLITKHSKQPTKSYIPHLRKKSRYKPLLDNTNPYIRLVAVLELVKMGHTKFYKLILEQKMPKSLILCRVAYWRVDQVMEALNKLQNEATNKPKKIDV